MNGVGSLKPARSSPPRSRSATPDVSYSTFSRPSSLADRDRHAPAETDELLEDGVHSLASHGHSQNRRRKFSNAAQERRAASTSRLGLGRRKRREHRSISQTLLRAVAFESESEDELGLLNRRSASEYFVSHPTSYGEALATYTPRRVSAIVRQDIDEDDLLESREELPYGVRKMEAIQPVLSKGPLYAAILFITLFTSLSSTTTPAVEPYLLSSFNAHSYVSSLAIVISIAFAVCKPPMAVILDIFGRAEGLALSALLYGAGFLLVFMSNGIISFAIARVIGSAGAQGINLAQQVIVADITTLDMRGLVTSTIFLPWLMTPWIGPPIGQWFKDLGEPGYRAAYTVFGVLVPVSCLFLLWWLWRAYARILLMTKQAKPALQALENAKVDDAINWQPSTALSLLKDVELDYVGMAYLTFGCTLFLLPISLAADRGWSDPLYPTLALFGLALLGILCYHSSKATNPLLPTRLLTNRTVLSGCLLGSFHFFSQFAYESYFPSFLQVARYHTARDASFISESYVFTASVAALLCGYLVKVTRRYKMWLILGILIHMVGAWMMVQYRSLNNSTWQLVISQVIGGFGGGFTTLSAQLGIQTVVDHQDVAIVTAVFLTITQIGGAVGGACSGAIWTTLLPRRLREYVPGEDWRKIYGSMSEAMSYPPGSPQREGINRAYMEVQRYLNLTALLGLLPALFCALLMQNIKLGNGKDNDTRTVLMADVIDDESDEA